MRVWATRHYPRGASDLIDALLLISAFETDDDPRDVSLADRCRPYVEAVVDGRDWPNPILEQPGFAPRGPHLAKVASSMAGYLRIGLYWWERTAIPRRWLLEAREISRARLAGYVLTQLGGFGPIWSSHLPVLGPHRHLTEIDFVESHLGIAAAIRRAPDVLGIASGSWYYDPALERVSPRLAFASRIVRENGGVVFEVRRDQATAQSALAASATRRRAAVEGRYRPRQFARLWGRRPFLAWAERQAGRQIPMNLGKEAPRALWG
jgi:hypothetical protein